MPEIMSAEEFASSIPLDMCYGEVEGVNEARTAELIHSRDSAMLEKYKEAIVKQWCRNTGQDEMFNDAMIDATLRSLVFALDSAFAEIEGGK